MIPPKRRPRPLLCQLHDETSLATREASPDNLGRETASGADFNAAVRSIFSGDEYGLNVKNRSTHDRVVALQVESQFHFS